MENKQLAFLLGRITLGINFAAHGFIRLPKIGSFSEGMVTKFQDSVIGIDSLISVFAHGLVFAELLVGIALLIGFKTRASLIVTSVIMMMLIFGSSMLEDWTLVGSQMIYVIFIYLLIYGYTETKYSFDNILSKN
jgi:thiosulfate dehydrogenase [quinone] large subunit